MARNLVRTLLAAALALPGAAPAACAGVSEFDVKSAYVYNFVQLVDWPAREEGADAPITICEMGGAQLGAALSGLGGRRIGGRGIQVRSFTAADDPLPGCHVLVLGRAVQDELPEILRKLEGSDVLTVGDMPQFARKGGMIGFVIEEGRVRIEINARAARRAGIKVSGKLMEVARIVR